MAIAKSFWVLYPALFPIATADVHWYSDPAEFPIAIEFIF